MKNPCMSSSRTTPATPPVFVKAQGMQLTLNGQPGNEGERLYDYFVAQARAVHPQVATGRFGADMQVHLVNDGPVTIPLRMVPTGT